MNKLLFMGLLAVYAALSTHAAIAAGTSISGPAPSIAAADQPVVQQALPQPRNFDASLINNSAKTRTFGAAKPQLAMPETINSGLRYFRTRPDGVLSTHYDEQLDRPTFIWASDNVGKGLDFYAYKHGEGALSYAPAYLKQFASRLKIVPSSIDQAELVFLHDDGEGPVIARYQQRVNGLEVMNRQLNVVMNQNLELIAITGYFATAKAARNEGFSNAFRGGPTKAMNAMFNDLGIGVSAYNLYDTTQSKAGFSQFAPLAGSTASLKAATGIQLTAPVGAKKVLFPVDGALVPGYLMLVRASVAGNQDSLAYAYVASADGSRVLYRKNLVSQDSYQYRVFADATTKHPDDSPFGNGLVPFPGSFPLTKVFGAGTLVTVDVATQGITDPWLPAPIAVPPGLPGGGPLFVPAFQTTFGNNVYAYADVGGADGPDDGVDVFAATTAAGAFDYTIDFTQQPDATTTDNQQASIVNLFYLNNWLHDAWYNAGFTEVTGNAQYSNYGRGGVEDTYILAEAQDFSGRNNANMATGPDGTFTRMQMYIFDGPIASQTTQATSSGGTGPFIFDPAVSSSFGDKEFDITAEIAIYNDGDASGTGINGELDACQPTAQDLTGKIALIGDIYTCNFTVKIKNAQNAGAIGALVVYNGAPNPDQVFAMGGSDPTVTIPSLGVSDDDANPVFADIGAGNTVTLHMAVDLESDRDGSFDSQVVAHEFFHYVSNRLVGDSTGLSNVQGGGMGEGWGDMAGLLLSVRKDDLINQSAGFYTIGGYDVDDFLFGIRRLPYTTNIGVNDFTFADLSLSAEVHNVGEIWVLPLWEAYVAMFQHYNSVDPATAFDVTKSKMMNYIIEGLMITPNAPTMIEARDAILISALATSETDYEIFVEAFAKRGMGFGAIAPPRNSTTLATVTESFKTEYKIYSLDKAAVDTNFAAGTCDADGTLDPNETGQVTFSITNTGSADLASVTAQLSSTSDVTFANNGVVTFDTLTQFNSATTTTLLTVNNAASTSDVITVDVSFPDIGADAADVIEPAAIQLQFVSNQDYQATLFADDVENAAKSQFDWSTTAVGAGVDGWVIDGAFSGALGLPADNDYWYGVDSGAQGMTTLVTPTMVVGDDPFSVSFYHYYQFEAGGYDGGVVEISINGGDWVDVTSTEAGGTFAYGYTGSLLVTGFGNPLEGRDGFIGFGGTLFDGTPESISFGTGLAGNTVQFRFVVGTDESVGDIGWIVDDFTVTGATQAMFSSVEPENERCVQVPVANAGGDQTVTSTAVVTLHGDASTDPQGSELAYAWTQTGGPSVSLQGADTATPTFQAPESDAQNLTFELKVTDPIGNSDTDSVKITTVNNNDIVEGGGSVGLLFLASLLGLGLVRRRR